jgi:D-alanine-D-alanine ligase
MTTSKIFSTDRVESSLQTPSLSVLHLFGSAVSEFYYKLSLIYAREVVQPAKVRSHYAVVHPDGLWQLGESLDKLSAKISFPKAIALLPQVDVVVPHMC